MGENGQNNRGRHTRRSGAITGEVLLANKDKSRQCYRRKRHRPPRVSRRFSDPDVSASNDISRRNHAPDAPDARLAALPNSGRCKIKDRMVHHAD